jgi:hypothetical protein
VATLIVRSYNSATCGAEGAPAISTRAQSELPEQFLCRPYTVNGAQYHVRAGCSPGGVVEVQAFTTLTCTGAPYYVGPPAEPPECECAEGMCARPRVVTAGAARYL